MSDQLTYSNPRQHVEINDWPIGGKHRGKAIFHIETKKGRQRVSRTCERVNAPGIFGKPKVRTYSDRSTIVDGSDGRTYVLEWSSWGNVVVLPGTLKCEHESISEMEQPERYAELCALMGVTS